MSDIYNTWKGKSSKVSKSSILMIGMVYQSSNYLGVLISIEDDDGVLQLKDQTKVKVQIKSLKIKV